MIFTVPAKLRLSAIFVFLLNAFSSIAQKADFTADKTGGCSPLDVRFTNTSTGFSANTDYKWEFGNGNTSKLLNPGTTYKEEKTYSVKLTVTDDGKTYTKTMDVIVYKTPQVAFSANIAKGCLPLPVTFTSSSTAGDGSISSYFWDFGDGQTQSANQQIQHTYTTPQTVSATLTVTNSHGCYNTLTKNSIIQVLPSVVVNFTADKTVLCKIFDAVTFNNTSTGPGTLSYTWDFGDGKTSTDKNPSHVFGKKGTYTIKLTVKSSEGCSNEITQNAYINVANFTSDFEAPPLVCENTTAIFTDKSSPAPNTQSWLVNGSYYYYYASQLSYTPPQAGQVKIQLVNTYGTCLDTATKNVTVKASPKPNGFIADMQGVCGSPVTVKFKDTTKTAVKWEWDFDNYYYSFTPTAFTQDPSYTYTSDGTYYITLRVANSDACKSETTQYISVYKTNAYISRTDNSGGCETLTTTFSAYANTDIKEYKWSFGDTFTSTDQSPVHTFAKPGNYTVTLNYTDINGCKGTASHNLTVFAMPVFDFTASATTICGNTPVSITVAGTNLGYIYWNFGDNSYDYYLDNHTAAHQYYADTTYTVRVIVSNGSCVDTVTKANYIKVLPPFPKISEVINTCDGTRGEVTFKETSQKAIKWSWDFGDNSAPLTYTTAKAEIKHTYTKTGSYKVVLTASNGDCSVRDSITVYVLLKQKPLLSSTQTEVCSNIQLNATISQMETNPAYNYYYYYQYSLNRIEYGDGSLFNGYTSSPDYEWRNTYHLNLNNLDASKRDIRIITQSYYFGCLDTTNLLPLKIKGPVAGFEIESNNICFKSPVILKDTSKGTNNVPIEKWEWNYGDNKIETLTKGGLVNHAYESPGYYYVSLKVTDKDGCTANSDYNYYSNYVSVKGPKAAFSMSANPVSPENTVYFYNTSNTYNTNYYDNHYKWLFGDGATSTDDYSTSHFYTESGMDTIMLIATNDVEHCIDTAIQYLRIKNLNLAYTYTTSFINPGSGCPPLLANFTNASINTTRVTWDFGDGGTADNLNTPSHTYQKPGVYKITLYGYFDNGKMDSTFDYITIKGPYATLKVDKPFSCGAEAVTLTAEAKNTTSLTWDFGDGTLLDVPDTFAVHNYLTPGVYTPSLIVKDGTGCSFPFFLGDKIIIDTLHFTIKNSPALICDSGLVSFTPDIISVAKNDLQQTLQYSWKFGTGNSGDTSAIETPSFVYKSPGSYPVLLKINSPYGCVEQVTDTIVVKPKAKGAIAGPSEICEDNYATFTATATNNNNLTWQWQFGNNSSSTQQNPPAQLYNDAGIKSIRLIVNRDGCYDTTFSTLTVHGKPAVNLTPKEPLICLGDSVQLQAHDGVIYTWTPSAFIGDTKIENPFVFPQTDTKYVAKVTNSYGCINEDSVTVQVKLPFTITAIPEVYECRGSGVQLNSQGADKYLWIDAVGLSNSQIANPVATVDAEKTYTVVGYDNYGCFTDTAFTKVKIAELPTVNIGADTMVLAGNKLILQGVASSDVVKWNWQPTDYLSCTSCASPVSTPHSDITYTAEVTTNHGCTQKDNITITILCKQSQVYIPTAFTPNRDGKNERFKILGNSIKLIKHFIIFDRWGKTVYEKINFNSYDQNVGWNGTYNGEPAPSGSYVYMAEVICDAGEVFNFKGSVILLR